VVCLIVSREQKVKVNLGRSDEYTNGTKIEARTDGGFNINPTASKCGFPMFSVEVMSLSNSDLT
jgi:hypothetical protein